MTPPDPGPVDRIDLERDGAEWSARVGAYYDEFVRLARLAIWGVTRAKLDPEDVVQDTFLLAFARRHQFRGRTQAELGGWLRQILSSQLSRVIRHYHETQARAGEVAGAGSVPVDPGTSPSGGAARREAAGAVDAALARLPEDYRLVLVLRERHGLSFAEIAGRLGRTENAARKLWPRALLALREHIPTDL